jgi:hypothetical protein
MNARKSAHTSLRLRAAKVLLAIGILAIAGGTVVSQTPPFWRNTGNLNAVRGHHTATLLTNGKVLVAGGRDNGGNPLTSAELYDPALETWTTTGGLHLSRWGHSAVLLGNGKVLVVGGVGAESSAELYDPVSGTWTVTGNLRAAKVQTGTVVYPPPGVVLLANGKVLAVGGGSAEIYDPASGSWALTGSPNTVGSAATILQNGKVLLVARGSGAQGGTAELFDPAFGSWTLTGSLNPSFDHFYEPTLTLLANGKVLAVGGQSTSPGRAELYDPVAGTWSTANFQGTQRQFGHTATLLSDGDVIVVGGFATSLSTNAVNLFDTPTSNWSNGVSSIQSRAFHTATLLGNGKVLVAGGGDLSRGIFATAELYDDGFEPVVLTADQVTIKTWTFQGRTFVHVKLSFPNAGYRVTNWGQVDRIVNVFSADATVERLNGPSVQAVTTTAQIYDLGPLADGNYTFTFRNSGVTVKSQAFSVSSVVSPPNPIDDARQFVKQQYRDFLNREADQAGEDFWTDNITKCSDPARRPPGQTIAQCTLRQRETTSGAFFLSPEFQYTGYFVYRMYQGALGRQPKLSEFTPDAQTVANGIIVGGQLSAAKINQNKAAFAATFVNCVDATKSRCAEFKAIYDGLNNPDYVDKLFQTTGVTPSASERAALINGLNGGTESRASVLQKVVDGINVISEGNQQFTTTYGQAFYNSEFNRAFVLLEYFGYMKRDPDEAGYAFWLAKLNEFSGDFVKAEMVLAFITSPEYRARFGQP